MREVGEEQRGRGGRVPRAAAGGARVGGGMAKVSVEGAGGGVDVGARGRAGGAPDSTESRVCGKKGVRHDCEWQLRCGKVLILCLSLKSSLWRGSGVNHLRRRSIRAVQSHDAVAILQPMQDRGGGGGGHTGGRRSRGVWRRSGRRASHLCCFHAAQTAAPTQRTDFIHVETVGATEMMTKATTVASTVAD